MKKIYLLSKTLLVAVCLLVGATNAWGDDITSLPANYALNSSTDPFDAGTIKTGTNVTALNVNNTTATAWFNTDGNRAPYTLATDEEVTISFTAYHGWNDKGADQGVKLVNSGGYTIAEYVYTLGSCNLTAVNIGGSTATGWSSAYNCQSNHNNSKNANGFSHTQCYQTTAGWNPVFTFKIRYDGYVSLNVYFPNRIAGNVDNTYTGTLPDGWAVDLQKIQVYSGTNSDDRTIAINNLSISSEIAERHTVTFTYEDTDGKSLSALKANSTVQAVAGTSIESLISSSMKASFYNGDASIRYDYSAFAADGSATEVPTGDITVKMKFAPKDKFTHTAQAVEKDNTSNVLKADLASGYAYAGEDLKLHWSKYIYASSKWYETTTFTGTYTSSGTSDIEFSSSDINYFFEFEDMTKSGSFAATSSGDGRSNNNSARLGKSSRVWTTALAAGTYTLKIYCYGENAKSPTLSMYYCNTDGSNLVYIGEAAAASASSWALKETTGIVIPEGKALCFNNTDASYNSNYLADYITLKRTGDASTTVNLNANGYATYSTCYDVKVSGADAYTAELDFAKETITCTKIASNKVPAGNGVLLYGEPNAEVTLTVVADAAALGTNNLKATTNANGTLVTKGSNDYYSLSGDTFKKFTGDAFVHNKAYFEVTAGGEVQARSMRITFGGITGVENVEATEATAKKNGAYLENGKIAIYKNGMKFNAAGAQMK